MRMIVTWLLGVPVAVAFFFAVFAVDASKITPKIESIDRPQSIAIAPTAQPN
jgi:hypothetical protein